MRVLTFTVCRWLGLFPFNNKGKFSWLLLLYTVACVLSILAVTVYLRSSSWWGNRFSKYIHLHLSTSLLVVQNFSFLVHLKSMYIHRPSLEKFMSCNPNYKCYSCPLCISLILPLILITSAWLCFHISKLALLVKIIVLLVGFCHCYSFLIALQFSHLISTVTHLHFDNDEMYTQIKLVFKKRTYFDGVIMNFMEIYNLQLLGAFANSFGYLVWVTYSLHNPNQWYIRVFFVMSIIVKWATVCLPCIAVELYFKKLDNHYNKLFNIMKTNPVLCKKASLYLYVTTKHSVKLTVCGFFTLGYPLITSIIAGCATYLVVLIQFSS